MEIDQTQRPKARTCFTQCQLLPSRIFQHRFRHRTKAFSLKFSSSNTTLFPNFSQALKHQLYPHPQIESTSNPNKKMPPLYFTPLHLDELLTHQLAIQTARQEAITAESHARIDAIKAWKHAQLVSIRNATETCAELSTRESKQRARCVKAESEASGRARMNVKRKWMGWLTR